MPTPQAQNPIHQQTTTQTSLDGSLMNITANLANPELVSLIAQMFTVWKKNFTTKMKAGAWDLSTAQVWAVSLQQQGMTKKRFIKAYQASLSLEWMPSTPAQFAKLSMNFGQYPSIKDAYLCAANGEYPHAVVYETAKRVGFYELRHSPQDKTWARWIETYEAVLDEAEMGANFTLPISRQLTCDKPPASAEFVNDIFDKLKHLLRKRKSV